MYDLVVIGAGWAGFNASIRAKELGLKVALIEEKEIGGTCLNLGCIPTKSLINSAKVLSLLKKSLSFGVSSLNPTLDFSKMMERKSKVIGTLRTGMNFMLKGVDVFKGTARIISAKEVVVNENTLKTKFIIIATGSKPQELESLKFDKKKVISSNEALILEEIPASLLIVGGGAIGCEFADLFATLGSKVTLVEKEKQLLPDEDIDISSKLESLFRKKNINVKTGSDGLSLNLEDYNLILVCIGRSAFTEISGLKEVGVKIEKGRIITDGFLKTDVDNIYAAGDCTSEIMLAHLAGYQGKAAADNIFQCGNKKIAIPPAIPNCIFTDPEISSVGLTEKKAKEKGIEFNVKKFDFMASGMAQLINEPSGLLKIISDSKSGKLLGFSMIGPRAAEISGIFALAISCGLKTEDIRSTVFAHPTISEAIGETLGNSK